jgi:radical SAM superfamily enzyme YgiQ (UPF0313 family)
VRVLLISANTETINMPTLPLGLACVAAATRAAGHEVQLLDLMLLRNAASAIAKSIRDFRPRVIGVSVRNIDDQNLASPHFLLEPVRETVAVCQTCSAAPIVLGGAGYSIFPEAVLSYTGADLGLCGEGERIFPELLELMAEGAGFSSVPGICVKGTGCTTRSYVRDLDCLPLPEAAFWIPKDGYGKQFWVPVQTRRGCPLNCSFCSTAAIEGRSIRKRSTGEVVKWLAALRNSGHRNLVFVDNTFNLPPAYAKDLCRQIIDADLDLSFWCLIYPKWVDNELVNLMKAAGCAQVSLGFESGSDRVLRALGKWFNKEEVRTVAQMFQRAGIERRGFLLLGGPGETRDTVEESLSLADSLQLENLNVTVGIRIYPDTAMARAALVDGITTPDDNLLRPRFYLAPAVAGWLPGRISEFRSSRPWVS